MHLLLAWLLCLFFSNAAFSSAWLQESGSYCFEHSFFWAFGNNKRLFGPNSVAVNNEKTLQRLVKGIGVLKTMEIITFDQFQAEMKYEAHRDPPEWPAHFLKMAKFRNPNYWLRKRDLMIKRHQMDDQRKDILTKLLYSYSPRLHYNAVLEYGLANCTVGCKFMYDKFQSEFLKKPNSFTLRTYCRQKLMGSDSRIISVQPYGEVKYCNGIEWGLGVDLLMGKSRPSKKQLGKIKLAKIFRNHSVGFYYPLNTQKYGDVIEVRTENTIGKELESGFGFYAQHFWRYSVSPEKLVATLSCHRAQTSVYKRIGPRCSINVGFFIETTKFDDVNHLMHRGRFTPKLKFNKNPIGKAFYAYLQKEISSKSIFNVIHCGINGSISWIF